MKAKLAGLLVAAAALLAGCDAAVHVDATANVPARYDSVLVTVDEVWFDESATAVPADATWQKFRLDEPRTIDLADFTGGEVASLARDLVVPAATYRQMRLVLADTDDNLRDSAVDAGATWNNQVTWLDDTGALQTLPLQVLNADQGIGIPMKLKVNVTLGDSTGTSINTVQTFFDAARDLTRFDHDDETGVLLNPTLSAFDADDVGTIRGTLSLAGLGLGTQSRRPDIEVIAQQLDEDLGRWVMAGSASVATNGTFVLYPLPLDDTGTTEVDLVIHGPRIRTIVIRDVPVTAAAPDGTTALALGNVALEPAESFQADISEDAPVTPRGARVGFYQTLPGEDAPHLVAVSAVDPLDGRLSQPVRLSRASTISYGTYGANFTLRTDTPEEGAARYAVAALSPHYGSGAFAAAPLRPATTVTDVALFSVPSIGLPGSAEAGTIAVAVTVDMPGRFDRGALVLSRDGAVVTVAPLDPLLQQSLASGTIDVTQVPAGTSTTPFDRGLYHFEAWTWRAEDPGDTFTRHAGAAAVDLRATSSAPASVTIH